MADNQEQEPLLVGTNETVAPPLAANVPPTSRGSPLHKRRCSSEEEETESNKHKRPKVILDDPNGPAAGAASASSETKTVVTPTSTATKTKTTPTASTTAAASASTSTAPEATTETLDLADTLGLQPGTQIEVQWEIHNDNDESKRETEAVHRNAAASSDPTAAADPSLSLSPSVALHWWKATLMEHDGRTTDSVAVRTLHYEARPDLGFPEPSNEDVVFLGKDVLATSANANAEHWEADPDSVTTMPYRRLHANSATSSTTSSASIASDEVFYYNEDELEDQLNTLLMGAFRKNQAAFSAMPAAQQAFIAETIRTKKEELAKILRAEAKENNNQVITPEAIRAILARTF